MGEVIDILEAYPGSAFSFMLFSISTVHLLELLPFSRKQCSCHGYYAAFVRLNVPNVSNHFEINQ